MYASTEHTHTQTYLLTDYKYTYTLSWACANTSIYHKKLMGSSKHLYMYAMSETMVFCYCCEVTLIVLMEMSARSMQRLLCRVARPFLHLSPLHDGVVEVQHFAEP